MVTPYITGAISIVFLLWVTRMNCVCADFSCTRRVTADVGVVERRVHLIRMQNGLGE
jgi:hypothetical protein